MTIFNFPLPYGNGIGSSYGQAEPTPPGYGELPYGEGQYGSALGTIGIAAAFALDTHTVRVVLSSPPLHSDPFIPGDALNPATWQVIRNDTDAEFTVLGVFIVGDATFDLRLFEPLASHFVTHTISSVTLLAIGGAPISNPRAADFLGAVENIDPIKASAIDSYRDRDLKNPPFSTGGLSGALVIGSDNDYANEDGPELVRKLALRRLTTPRGGFKHLPDYGVGILEKEPIPGGSIVKLRTDIERQIALEPDVQSVRAVCAIDRSNTLLIQLQIVMTKTGNALDFGVQVRDRQIVEL